MKIASLTILSALLAGCSTLQGQPTPVVDMTNLTETVSQIYSPAEAIRAYNGAFCTGTPPGDDGSSIDLKITRRTRLGFGSQETSRSVKRRCIYTTAEKRDYRDEVLFTYMAAVDGRYRNFVSGISSQRKSGNAMLSVLGLYTSALASVSSGGLATGFAASSTFLQGSQGKLNKDLFYEQTMPALINLMNAERVNTRASIMAKVTRDRLSTSITYSLPEALMDIARYEEAASIEKAVATLVQQASQKLTDAQENEEAVDKLRAAVGKAK